MYACAVCSTNSRGRINTTFPKMERYSELGCSQAAVLLMTLIYTKSMCSATRHTNREQGIVSPY